MNNFTNYDSLNQVIDEVNTKLKSLNLTEHIVKSIVEIRDAFAHGRILGLNPDGPLRIFKFDKPKEGKTQVAISLEMTPDWLAFQINRITDENEKIIRISQSLGSNGYLKPSVH